METRSTILVVDDEREIGDVMRDFLEAEGFGVEIAQTGQQALARLAEGQPDCLLLDVMLPGQSGFDLCRRIRATSDVPILFLTARDGDMDKIRGLGQGADDYIVKSATAAEVVARVKAVLRRTQRAQPAVSTVLDFGRLRLDLRAHEVSVDGRSVTFSAREFEALRYLVERPRQVFTRDQLLEHIWGEYGDPHTVTVYIKRIREKIERDPAQPEYIVTIWGVGYRFEGRIQ